MAGMVGCGGGPGILFFPSRCLEAAGLKEGVGDHCHQGVSVQSCPGSAFKVIETKFLLELLMRLFTDPTGLDRGRERLERGIGREVRDVVFLLAGRAALTDKPDFLARHGLHAIIEHPVLVSICNPDAGCGEEAGQPSLGALPPAHFSPLFVSQHQFSGGRETVRDVVLAGPSTFRDGEDQGDVSRIDVLAPREPNRPVEAALAQSLTERPA